MPEQTIDGNQFWHCYVLTINNQQTYRNAAVLVQQYHCRDIEMYEFIFE